MVKIDGVLIENVNKMDQRKNVTGRDEELLFIWSNSNIFFINSFTTRRDMTRKKVRIERTKKWLIHFRQDIHLQGSENPSREDHKEIDKVQLCVGIKFLECSIKIFILISQFWNTITHFTFRQPHISIRANVTWIQLSFQKQLFNALSHCIQLQVLVTVITRLPQNFPRSSSTMHNSSCTFHFYISSK